MPTLTSSRHTEPGAAANSHPPLRVGRLRLSFIVRLHGCVMIMRTILKYVVTLIFTYFLAWTGAFAYLFCSNGETVRWDLYWEYFFLAWTFRVLELVAFTWFFSIIAFVPLSVLAIILVRKYGQQTNNAA